MDRNFGFKSTASSLTSQKEHMPGNLRFHNHGHLTNLTVGGHRVVLFSALRKLLLLRLVVEELLSECQHSDNQHSGASGLCAQSPALLSLYMHDCVSRNSYKSVFKFASTTVVGRIMGNDVRIQGGEYNLVEYSQTTTFLSILARPKS